MKSFRKTLAVILVILFALTGGLASYAAPAKESSHEKDAAPAKATAIAFAKTTPMKLRVGYKITRAAVTTPEGLAVNYSSSDPKIATVNAAGKVVGIKKGTAVITAFCGDVNASYTVDVVTPDSITSKPKPEYGEHVLEVVKLTNEKRASQGLNKLKIDDDLMAAAQKRSQEIQTNYSHYRPNGNKWTTVLGEYGIRPMAWAENISKSQKTPEEVTTAWWESPGHKKNMLGKSYTSIGVGCSRDSNGKLHWVQLFTD